MFGLGPVPAVRQALQRAGWDIRSVERIEINEAFAVIAIVVARELGLPDDIVNVEGGAVAHDHPIGATGAVLTTKLIHSMRRDGLKRGIVTLCIGGGQGIALAIETVHWKYLRDCVTRRLAITANEHSAKQESWIFRFWRILAAWDPAISASPFESLEKPVAALEQATFGFHDRERAGDKKRSG